MMKKMMLKRTGTTLILLVFLITAVLSSIGTKLEVYADTYPTLPDLSQIMPNIVATVEGNVLYAGKTANVVITLKNISTESIAREVIFTPIYDSGSTAFASIKPITETPIKKLIEMNQLKLNYQ